MAQYLRYNTASQEIQLGKFVDDTDGKTAETTLSIANTDIKLFKHGATSQASKNSGGATHIANGHYYAVLDATDTDTLGNLEVTVDVSGALSVRREYVVLPAMVFDSMILGTDVLQADVTQFNGTNGTFSSGRPEVNTTHVAGTSQTAKDLGAINVTNLNTLSSHDPGATIGTSTLTQTQVTGGAYALNSASFAFNSALDLTTTQKASVNAEADTALTDYGALKPTTAGRTLDVTATGEAGIDWANVGSPTTALNLSGTTISTSQAIASVSGAVGSVTGAVGSVTGAVGSVTGNVGGNVTGSVGSISSGGITAASIAADAITAAKIADGAIDRATFATDTGMQTTRSNTAQAGAAGTITLDASASATTDFYKGMCVYLTSGTGSGQARVITAYNGTTKIATITPNWATNPDNTSTFAVMETAASDLRTISGSAVSTSTAQLGVNAVQAGGTAWGSGAITAASIASDAITDAKVASDVTIASVTGAVGSVTGNVGGNVTGSVGSVTGNVGGNVTGSVGSVATGGITAASIAADAIGASELAADAVTEIQSGLATAANLATLAGYVDTEVAAIKAVTDQFVFGTANRVNAQVYGIETGAITAGSIATDAIGAAELAADAVTEIQSGLATASALSTAQTDITTIKGYTDDIGVAGAGLTALAAQSSVDTLAGYVDTEVAAIKAKTDQLTFTNANKVDSTAITVSDKTGYSLSSAAIQAIWDAATSALTTVGSIGKWIVDKLDVVVSTRASQTSVDTVDDFLDTEVAAIKAKTDTLPASPANEATLTTIAGYIDTEVAAIKAKTDNLPTDPADQSLIEAVITAATSPLATAANLATLTGYVDTEVAAIKAKTDNLPSDPADASDIAASFATVNTKLDTIDDFLDTEVASIKAKTDSLTFTVAGKVDSNLTYVNGTQVDGSGTSGDPWGPV